MRKRDLLIQATLEVIKGYDIALTLRQIFYRLVSNGTLKNTKSEYQALSRALVYGRLEGQVPWDTIEDRSRGFDDGEDFGSTNPRSYFADDVETFESAEEDFRDSWQGYHYSRWHGQPKYVAVVLEKDALSRLFSQVTSEEKVDLAPVRGYPSLTYLNNLADRLTGKNKDIEILYFGDFDPSGEDIERYVTERLEENFGIYANIRRIAITPEQIEKYNIPPMPAKRSDSRTRDFVDRHGDVAVELDAIEPTTLQNILKDAIREHFDQGIREEMLERERQDRESIKQKIMSYFGEEVGSDA